MTVKNFTINAMISTDVSSIITGMMWALVYVPSGA